jgi:hypothetical protein
VSARTRAVVEELLHARNARSPERAARVLGEQVRYWDAVHGALEGREAVAAALMAADSPLALETVAAADSAAVAELQAGAGRRTEVYRLGDGSVTSLKAYFDPTAVEAV